MHLYMYKIKVQRKLVNFVYVLVFKGAPPTPPSFAQMQLQSEEKTNFFVSLKRLVVNVPYMQLLTAYGINVGIFYAISTLLNQIVLQYYPVSCSTHNFFMWNSAFLTLKFFSGRC